MLKADKVFIENIKEIMENGNTDEGQKVRPHYADGVEAHTIFITQVVEKYNIANNEFPITTLRPIYIKKAISEILWIYQDQTENLEVLKDKHGITWWDEWDIGNRTIGQRYGATVRKYDLMNGLLKGLKNEPYGRRHIVNLYQYADFKESKGLYPCAFETLWSVRGEYLDMTLSQRSSDYLVAGHINKMQYVALMMMVARHVGLKPGNFMHVVQNLHIYDRHLEQARELLSRTPSEKTPRLILKEGKTDFYSFTVDDFELVDYEPVKPQLKFELGI
ncbi:thymidylate synthase [Clostridium swellfunianum]|uniref:thymidylate synthase n=1 Tax=Clostridium swellfunianum TaxID=1367462 RepID=UPI00202FDCDE|nr:thymidylate synthase [Clostridium swellfunianum]MCM0647992.1 thymidylate synthase [Clostridium swellfunianum]